MSIRTRTDARGRRTHQVRLPGERAQSFPTHKAAKEYELKRKVYRASGGQGEAAKPITLADALEGAIARWVSAASPAPASIASAYDRAAFWIRAGLGGRRLDVLGLVECEDAIVTRASEHRAAAKQELEWFKRALMDAQRRGQRFDPALLNIPPIRRRDEREGIALDVADLQWLASWFPPYLVGFPEIVGALALRLGEALTLTDDRIDLARGSVFIPARLNKEGRDKVIELAGFERELIEVQREARPKGTALLFPRVKRRGSGAALWNTNYFREQVWRPARAAASRELREVQGLPEWEPTRFDLLIPHDLRHTGISSMAAGGMRPEVIAKRVGHSDGGKLILERYRHLFPDEMGLQLAAYEAWRNERRAVPVAA